MDSLSLLVELDDIDPDNTYQFNLKHQIIGAILEADDDININYEEIEIQVR